MTPNGDIAVAFHTDREDRRPGTYESPLKQVEVALFRYTAASGTWTLYGTELLGSITHDPLGLLVSDIVKCERPDIIAVGDRFLVTWTRIYDPSLNANELAVLEAAWIRWDAGASQFKVFDAASTGSATGLGILIDSNYHVRQCAGVADAVVLEDGASGIWSAGIAYVHQTDFGTSPNWLRKFDLRFATCTITSLDATSKTTEPELDDNVVFFGATDGDAGLILPDLSRGSTPDRFVLAYEQQAAAGLGQIVLELREKNSGTGEWEVLNSHTFGSAADPAERRRANVASLPSAGEPERATIAFMQRASGGSFDVVFEEWQLDDGAVKRVWPPGHFWVNGSLDEIHPVPVHGRITPDPLTDFRRCYAKRNVPSSSLAELRRYDLGTNTMVTVVTQEGLKRPSAAYAYHAASGADFVALCWENEVSNGPGRVWLHVD